MDMWRVTSRVIILNEFIMSKESRAAVFGGHLGINSEHSIDYLICLQFQKDYQNEHFDSFLQILIH